MSTELPKTYDPSSVEATAYQTWLDEKCFHAEPSSPGEPYSIVIPPPNVTGALHLGHAINNTLQDILTRKARMEGKNALWMPGLDHAGIATQAVVEKQLKEQENKTRHDVGREGLVERIWKWKEQYGNRILSQLQRLGCSCDWDRTRFTLDDMCAKAVRETFFKLFKDGLVYRGKRLVNWDVHLQTSISDDEIYHETVKTHLWHIKYKIVDGEPGTGKMHEPLVDEQGTAEDGEGLQTFSSDPDSRIDLPTDASRITGASPVSSGSMPQNAVRMEGTDEHGEKLQTFSSDPESQLDLSNDNDPRDATSPHSRGQGKSVYMVVATTRPETLLGDTAVAVHSEDSRWNWAIGKFVELPLTGRKIPIIADDELVDPKFGSGVVKVTPAHDPNDYAVWNRHKGKDDEIDIINILNPDGTLNDNAGAYKGMKRDAARKKVVADLTGQGLLEKEEPYETQVGHSDRSKTAIEPYLSDQWFVKMAPLAEPALKVVRDGTIRFFPERHAQQYLSWLGEKRDWPISRQLWWGHRIPVWTVTFDPNSKLLTQLTSSGLNRPTMHGIIASEIEKLFANDAGEIAVIVDPSIVQHTSREDRKALLREGQASVVRFCVRSQEADSIFQRLFEEFERKRAGKPVHSKFQVACEWITSVEQDPDVLDTWFSSALWPHSTLGWPDATPELAKWYPTSVLLTGRDIITLWVARMVMMGMYNMGSTTGVPPVTSDGKSVNGDDPYANIENFDETKHPPSNTLPVHEIPTTGSDRHKTCSELGIPFHHVAINPTILDGKGERMSKSKGNGVDPVDVIDTHGADALRFTLSTMATETQDVRMPVKKDAQGRNTSDKFDLGRNFCNKLWNASRFALQNLESIDAPNIAIGEQPTASSWGKLTLADAWILSKFNSTIQEANRALSNYRFDQYAKLCYDFVWRDFCDWYVEIVKPTLKTEEGKTSAEVLTAVLDGSLRLLHPIIPFITETIWWKLNEVRPTRRGVFKIHKRLILSEWPKEGEVFEKIEQEFGRIQEIVTAIRNIRNEYNADAKKVLPVTIVAAAETKSSIESNRATIEQLALSKVTFSETPATGAVRASAGGVEVFISDLVDPAAEAQRKVKLIEEKEKAINTLEGRLNNPGYLAKAPANLVEQSKAQLQAAKEELKKLKEG